MGSITCRWCDRASPTRRSSRTQSEHPAMACRRERSTRTRHSADGERARRCEICVRLLVTASFAFGGDPVKEVEGVVLYGSACRLATDEGAAKNVAHADGCRESCGHEVGQVYGGHTPGRRAALSIWIWAETNTFRSRHVAAYRDASTGSNPWRVAGMVRFIARRP